MKHATSASDQNPVTEALLGWVGNANLKADIMCPAYEGPSCQAGAALTSPAGASALKAWRGKAGRRGRAGEHLVASDTERAQVVEVA